MKVYRISKTEYSKDLTGTGAKLFGGRWNHVDTPCIYTSESRALAVLEYSVNININFISDSLSLCTFEIDKNLIQEVQFKELPSNWKSIPSPHSTKTIGTDLLQSNTPIIKVPSLVIPEEFNYILNPLILGKGFRLVEAKTFEYDLRIKKV